MYRDQYANPYKPKPPSASKTNSSPSHPHAIPLAPIHCHSKKHHIRPISSDIITKLNNSFEPICGIIFSIHLQLIYKKNINNMKKMIIAASMFSAILYSL